MKAAVCYEFGKPLVIEELTMRAPDARRGEGQGRRHGHLSQRPPRHAGRSSGGLPFVGGHETAGHVEEVGSAVTCVSSRATP